MVLFKKLRDMSQNEHLGRQVAPDDRGFLAGAYRDATLENFSYLFLDLRPETQEECRYRSNILKTGWSDQNSRMVIYVPPSLIKSGNLNL
jgi:hypothetical protein